jgi:hypothetical protein
MRHEHEAQIAYYAAEVERYRTLADQAAKDAEIAFLDPDEKVFVAAAALADYANNNLVAAERGLQIAKYAAMESH